MASKKFFRLSADKGGRFNITNIAYSLLKGEATDVKKIRVPSPTGKETRPTKTLVKGLVDRVNKGRDKKLPPVRKSRMGLGLCRNAEDGTRMILTANDSQSEAVINEVLSYL